MSISNTYNPYFIIVAGPTASGKSTLVNKISHYLKNEDFIDKSKTNFISIDNLIEKNPYFKNEIDNYFKKQFKNNKSNIYNEFLYPSKKTIKFFNKIYWESRKNIDCVTGKKLNLKNKTPDEKKYKPCSQLIANDILLSLKNRKNVIFETTGITFPFWIFKQYPNDLMNYNLIIAWSIVDICDLYNRNKFRTLSTVKSFIETFAEDNAPRLPDIRKKNYKRSLINIVDTYKEFVKYHGNRSLSKLRLLLFDNRSKTSKNLYDSYINSDKTGYTEILKYNIHNTCDEKNTTFTLPPSRKSSPFRKSSPSRKSAPSRKSSPSRKSPPSRKSSLSRKSSPFRKSPLSSTSPPSRKSSPSLLSESSSINEKSNPKVINFTNSRQSLHNMTTRSKTQTLLNIRRK
ncbi:hypothetical protein OAH43_00735 [bacterium]|nr:hypothetical protein [bacterium]